jgi:hypothetical protein
MNRIDDLADEEPGGGKFGGRYRLRLKINKDSWASFPLDDYKLLTNRREEHLREWVTTDHYLEAASREVDAERAARYRDFMHDNELELALEELEGIAYEAPQSASYWENLRNAAENMGLDSHVARYRHKVDEVKRRR